MNHFPFDFSAASELVCARRYQIRCVMGVKNSNRYASYGSAVHKYIELRDKGEGTNPIDFLQKELHALGDTAGTFLNSCIRLDTITMPTVEHDIEGQPLIEWKFSIPYKQLDANTTAVICGTIDRIDVVNNCVRVLDYKTSANPRSSEVLANYQAELQIPFYIWMLKNHLHQFLPEHMSNMILANRIFGQIAGIFYTLNPPDVILSPSITFEQDYNQVITELVDDLLLKAWQIHQLAGLAYPEGMMYKICKNCPWMQLCSLKDDSKVESLLANQPKTPYNPMEHR